MKSVDIAEGRVYNRAMLDKIKQGLLNQYYELGRYNARVDVAVTDQGRNRVLINWLIMHKVPFAPSQGFLDEIVKFLKNPTSKEHTFYAKWKITIKHGKSYLNLLKPEYFTIRNN